MRSVRPLLLAVVVTCAVATAAPAQSSQDLTQQGIRAYRQTEFEAAAALFRRAIDFAVRDSASPLDRSRMQDYLAASELYRGRRDSATAVFRRVIQRDPRHRVDELIFPPEVSGLLDDIRRGLKTVIVEVPADTVMPVSGGRWNLRLLASSYHLVTVSVLSGSGAQVRELYFGPIGDSLSVQWDGRDSVGGLTPSGDYLLNVASTVAGQTVRLLKIPLNVAALAPDTLLAPPPLADSALLPERSVGRRSGTSLLAGIGVGLAAAVLPSVLASGASPSPARLVIGGAVGLAGIVGFVARPPSRPIPENVARNRTRRDAWRAQVQNVMTVNAVRRNDARIQIRAGSPTAVGSGAP